LSEGFLIQNGLKQEMHHHYCFPTFALQYVIRNGPGKRGESEIEWDTSADDANQLGDNIAAINKNKETLVDASKEVGLEIKVEKTKYVLLFHHQNSGQTCHIKIENVSQFGYLGTIVRYQNLIQEEINRRLNSDNECYHLVQNLLSYRLLFKIIKIGLCKNVNLPVVLYGCETWSLTLREEHRLKI
jgi:hypothetical protein